MTLPVAEFKISIVPPDSWTDKDYDLAVIVIEDTEFPELVRKYAQTIASLCSMLRGCVIKLSA